MTEPTSERPTDAATDEGRSAGGMPRWAKISLIVVAALIALFVILNLAGIGGRHGPGRHMPGGGSQHQPMDH